MQISSQGRSVAEIKKHGGGSDLQWIIAHKKKVDIGQAVMSIVRRTWAKYQQLLITHPLKTQTIGTGIVINEIPFLTSFVMKLMMDLRSAVAIWPVTGQGFQNTKWPAVLYYQ